MNKLKLLVGGASIVLSCAPAFSQGASPSATNNNYRGLQNLVDSVNSGQPGSSTAPAGNAGRAGGGHRWKGGGAGSGPLGANNGTGGGSAIGAGAGATGAGVDAIGKGSGKAGMDPAKRKERRQRILKRFDTNGDGILDENEKAKFEAFRAERRAQRQAQMGGQLGGGGGLGGANALNGPGGAGGPSRPDGPGGQLGGRRHRLRDGMPGAANQSAANPSTDSQPGLPGGRRGAPGEFPKGFPDGTGSTP